MTPDPEHDLLTATEDALGPDAYEEILGRYIQTRSEAALYQVSLLSSQLIQGGLGPEDIIALHFESCDRALAGQSYRERARAEADCQQFLLEVMIAYGVRFKEYLELRLHESLNDAEARVDEERQRVLDAERLGRQKDELLTVIAHELRTPITAARGNLDMARRMLNRGDMEHASGLLDSARKAMDRLSRLTGDLVEANRDDLPELVLESLELSPILSQACDWATSSVDAQGITIHFAAADAPVIVHGNEDALLSIFGNLLSNAVRYTNPGGTVTIREGQDDKHVWAEISDSGIGMSEEVQSRIFEKFYRAPEARTMEVRGLGLGLSLVQNLVKAHAGSIAINSEIGRGTTFRVSLPLVSSGKTEGAMSDE